MTTTRTSLYITVSLLIYSIPNVRMFTVEPTIADYHVSSKGKKKLQYQPSSSLNSSRRTFISGNFLSTVAMTSLVLSKKHSPAYAADDYDDFLDLTTQMYNSDGSLKKTNDGLLDKESEAKSLEVTAFFPSSSTSETAIVSLDGSQIMNSTIDTDLIKTTYQVPGKWTVAPKYIDTLLGSNQKACDRIIIYQVPGKADFNQLEKATTIGVPKALGLRTMEKGIFPEGLLSADTLSGKKVKKPDGSQSDGETRKYYEFDMAVAPDSCNNSAENLGLGFCPYDTILLLSATIVDEKMVVCGVQASKDEWKSSSIDLKRVRDSFFVESSSV